jgi:carbon-monoxide dehydrogenase medium subunit
MTPFELVEAGSLREAAGLLDPEDPTVRPIAGGTALMLMMKAGVFRPTRLISLRAVEGKYLKAEALPDGGLRIGAMTTLANLERSAAVREAAPVITRTLRTLSNIRVRNVATVGGSLAHGDPHMDLPPVLMALGAKLVAASPSGTREIALEDFYTGYYETALGRDELIAEVLIPPQSGRRACYLKCSTRSAHDWPALGVAVSLDVDGGAVREPKVVVSAATETATRLGSVESVLRGAAVDDALLRRAGEAAAEEANVVGDARGSAAYKRQLVRVYVERAIREALAI